MYKIVLKLTDGTVLTEDFLNSPEPAHLQQSTRFAELTASLTPLKDAHGK